MSLNDKSDLSLYSTKTLLTALFAAGVILSLGAALLIEVPGYMDAEYYYSGGLQIYSGQGFQDPFLWNYLDNPSGIPHPSHLYWMPLPSILSALGMFLLKSKSFFAGRFFFIMLSGLIPALSGWLAFRLTQKKLDMALAGGLAVFSGFYAMYLNLTESFALYMVLGALIMLLGFSPALKNSLKWAQFGLWMVLGLFAGCMHLSRADGILWLFVVICLWIWHTFTDGGKISPIPFIAIVLGYLIVMGAWYGRNIGLYGSLMAPGNSRTLWLTDYDQTFIYPAELLNFQQWLAFGWQNHALIRWDALLMNLKTGLAVQGEIFLLPFMLLGGWKLRKQPMVIFGAGMWLITLVIMSVVFPFAGSRGGFFHSGAALQPFLWALVPTGFDAAISFGVQKRGWSHNSARRFFGASLLVMAMVFTLGLFSMRVLARNQGVSVWGVSNQKYARLGQFLTEYDANKNKVVLVNNPPGFWLATGFPSLVIPNGDDQTLLSVAKKYQAQYILLEEDHVRGLDRLYAAPTNAPGLQLIGELDGTLVIKISGE